MTEKVKIEVPKWLADVSNIVWWVAIYLAVFAVVAYIFHA